MTAESKAFELQVHRIHELLESTEADVTWNDCIIDPDNPGRGRQIDITIRKDGKVTLVECRLHRTPQDVTWIEELFGRRVSLGADSVIAVSSSGFTKGAKSKAQRFGIILRDLRDLTDIEVSNWGRTVALTVYFYQYADLELSLFFDRRSIPNLDDEKLKAELKVYRGNQSLFNAAAEQLDTLHLVADENTARTATFQLCLQLEDFCLCGEPVVEVGFSGRAELVTREIVCPVVCAYGAPELSSGARDVVVEKFNLGRSSITHTGARVAMFLDISELRLPPASQFRYVRLLGSKEMDIETFEIVGLENLSTSAGQMAINIAAIDEMRNNPRQPTAFGGG